MSPPARRASPLHPSLAALFPALAALSCGGDAAVVAVGGSSSLYPLSEAVAEEYAAARPGARITVEATGTAGGLRRLCSGELDVAGASRPMSGAEAEWCGATGAAYVAVPIVRDGIAVVANQANTVAGCFTLDELRRVWEPSSSVTTWRDIRPAYPAEAIHLFGPGPGSGTFDFFTRVVTGRPGASRADHYQTKADNLIAHGVASDRWALGYFGSASFAANRERLRPVAVDTGYGCVTPTDAAVSDGTYSPLSRDLYLYVAHSTLARPEVRDFVRQYVNAAPRLGPLAGYVPLPPAEYERNRALLEEAAQGRR